MDKYEITYHRCVVCGAMLQHDPRIDTWFSVPPELAVAIVLQGKARRSCCIVHLDKLKERQKEFLGVMR